ncbi:hypothetical protein KIN20_001005 [Parelaphostrongylus tenuis]|uniref:Uncharacterized protein n=1 Tax=Parelaphostrongylus tenuis TaxID=148309 RepID=A0AAD5MBZ6_PARTN|nr:hypothetical protein KIN20_001005 [Parelaphostrongylus tenuis]
MGGASSLAILCVSTAHHIRVSSLTTRPTDRLDSFDHSHLICATDDNDDELITESTPDHSPRPPSYHSQPHERPAGCLHRSQNIL